MQDEHKEIRARLTDHEKRITKTETKMETVEKDVGSIQSGFSKVALSLLIAAIIAVATFFFNNGGGAG